MQLPRYFYHIKEALEKGYSVDLDNGVVIGSMGKPLKASMGRLQRYPTISLSFMKNDKKCAMSVPVHKVIAFAKFGEKAFSPKLQVRHLDRNSLNNRGSNLLLGTSSENQLDKPKEVRSYAARRARTAQGSTPLNAKLTVEQVSSIKKRLIHTKDEAGKRIKGSLTLIGKEFNVSNSVVWAIASGKNYKCVQ